MPSQFYNQLKNTIKENEMLNIDTGFTADFYKLGKIDFREKFLRENKETFEEISDLFDISADEDEILEVIEEVFNERYPNGLTPDEIAKAVLVSDELEGMMENFLAQTESKEQQIEELTEYIDCDDFFVSITDIVNSKDLAKAMIKNYKQ
jgi:hypothetical protein